MSNFDLKSILNAQSTGGQKQPDEVKLLPIDQIMPTEKNFYGMREIENLAAVIEFQGLNQNLTVRRTPDPSVYELIDGERRYRALQMLRAAGNHDYDFVRCLIKPVGNDIFAELNMMWNNATQRDLTDAEKQMQTMRTMELLKQLRDQGYPFKGRMREIVAKMFDVSPAQVGRYEKIETGLSPELKEELRGGNLGITEAYTLATLDEKTQRAAAQSIRENTRPVAKKKIEPIGCGSCIHAGVDHRSDPCRGCFRNTCMYQDNYERRIAP